MTCRDEEKINDDDDDDDDDTLNNNNLPRRREDSRALGHGEQCPCCEGKPTPPAPIIVIIITVLFTNCHIVTVNNAHYYHYYHYYYYYIYMQVVNMNLRRDVTSVGFGVAVCLDDAIQYRTAREQLHDDVDLVLHVHVHQLDAVRVLRARERRDFVLHVLAARLVALENLDSIHRLALSGLELVALGNETFAHLGTGALTQHLAQRVVIAELPRKYPTCHEASARLFNVLAHKPMPGQPPRSEDGNGVDRFLALGALAAP